MEAGNKGTREQGNKPAPDEKIAGKFDEWALLELFGHSRLAGKVTEAAIGGGAFVRVDVPDAKGRCVLTKFLSPQAIYAITPCDENVAVAAAQQIDAAPIQRYELEQLARTPRLPMGDYDEENVDGDED